MWIEISKHPKLFKFLFAGFVGRWLCASKWWCSVNGGWFYRSRMGLRKIGRSGSISRVAGRLQLFKYIILKIYFQWHDAVFRVRYFETIPTQDVHLAAGDQFAAVRTRSELLALNSSGLDSIMGQHKILSLFITVLVTNITF